MGKLTKEFPGWPQNIYRVKEWWQDRTPEDRSSLTLFSHQRLCIKKSWSKALPESRVTLAEAPERSQQDIRYCEKSFSTYYIFV